MLTDHNYVIALSWHNTIDGCDLERIVALVEKQFAGECPCFTVQENKLCVVLGKGIGEWNSILSGYFDALVQLGLIVSWKHIVSAA